MKNLLLALLLSLSATAAEPPKDAKKAEPPGKAEAKPAVPQAPPPDAHLWFDVPPEPPAPMARLDAIQGEVEVSLWNCKALAKKLYRSTLSADHEITRLNTEILRLKGELEKPKAKRP